VTEELTGSGGLFAERGDSGPILTNLTGVSERDLRDPDDNVLPGILPSREQVRRGGTSESLLFSSDAEQRGLTDPDSEGVVERASEGAATAGLSILNVRQRTADAESILEGAFNAPGVAAERGAGEVGETVTALARKQGEEFVGRARADPVRTGAGVALDVFGGAAALGRTPSAGDLRAEVDPRIGLFGETVESRALGLRSDGGRSFLDDDRAQADPLFGGQRGTGSDTTTITGDDLAGFEDRTTPDPEGEGQLARPPEDVSGGARDRQAAGLDEQGAFVGSNTRQQDPAFGGSGKPDTGESDFSGVEFRELERLRDDTDADARRDAAEQRSVDETATTPAGGQRAAVGGFAGALVGGALERLDSAQRLTVEGPTAVFGEGLGARTNTDVFDAVDEALAIDQDPGTLLDPDADTDADARADVDSDVDTFLDRDAATDADARADADTFADTRADVDTVLDPDTDARADADVLDLDRTDPDVPFPGDRRDDDDDDLFAGLFGTRTDPFENPVETPEEFLRGA
jgi:hypothetical protein